MKPRIPGDVLFAALMASVVALLIVPLPTPVLDVLLTTNIAFGVVLLLTAIYVRTPLQFSTFPAMLLVATLVRLALNVSSTRLILGQADAGRVIEAFGAFVVGGNYVVGAVIFLILTVIQFLVIAKGSERVAEVAARFTLDAMPGKQMAIDADLRAGAFPLAEARARREELQRESQLFGAMDGAMKFVKGDAIAGIIITVVNVSGGLIIGIAQRGMPAVEAAETYTLLTIGDGLVSQIPALIVSIAAGLIVTRVASGEEGIDLGSEMLQQLSATPKVFAVAAGLLAALGLVPGLPTLPFVGLALASGGLAVLLERRAKAARAAEDAAQVSAPSRASATLVPAVSPVLVELGAAIAEAVREATGEEGMREELHRVREGLFERLGVRMPPVRLRFHAADLVPQGLRVAIYEVPEVSALVDPERALVRAAPEALEGLSAMPAVDPMRGHPASTVPLAQMAAAQEAGHVALDPVQQVMLYVGLAAQRRAERFVGLAEVQASLDQLEATHGALIDAVVPRPVSLAQLTAVMKRLVSEGVAIRDLRGILEALAAEAEEGLDVVALTEIARTGLGPAIVARVAPGRELRAWMVDPTIEHTVRDAIRRDGPVPRLALAPALTQDILGAFRAQLPGEGAPVVVVSQDVRRYVRQLIALERPAAVVLGLNELQDGVRLEAVGTVRVGR